MIGCQPDKTDLHGYQSRSNFSLWFAIISRVNKKRGTVVYLPVVLCAFHIRSNHRKRGSSQPHTTHSKSSAGTRNGPRRGKREVSRKQGTYSA